MSAWWPTFGPSVTLGRLLEGRCVPSRLGFLKWQRTTPPLLHTYCLQRLRDPGRPNPAISAEAPRNPQPFHHQPGAEPGSQAHVRWGGGGGGEGTSRLLQGGLIMPRGRGRRCPGHFQFLGARKTPWQGRTPTTGFRVTSEREVPGPSGQGSRQSRL